MAKHKDLQPWLDYFDILQRYERKGFLEIEIDKDEAYITQYALHALTPGNDPQEQLASGAIIVTAHHIRTYAEWRSQAGRVCRDSPFALHVVKSEPPHDLLYTILITRIRSWWCPWRKTEKIEVINYPNTKSGNEK